jgi:transposase
LTASLREFPTLAERVGVEAADPKIMPELEQLGAGLTPLQRQELLLALIRGTFGKAPGAA